MMGVTCSLPETFHHHIIMGHTKRWMEEILDGQRYDEVLIARKFKEQSDAEQEFLEQQKQSKKKEGEKKKD